MSLEWLVARPIAHRGLHDAARGVVENSPSAARAAIARGFAIECDVQRTRDGEAVVFHDFGLTRLTGAGGAIGEYSLAELTRLRLRGGDDPIPTLTQFLALIAGRVPLVCEIKSAYDGDLTLCDRVADVAGDYAGPLAFKSFDPHPIAHLRGRGVDRPLGIVAQASYDDPYFAAMSSQLKRDCAAFSHIAATRPDFLSWCVDDLPHAAPSLFRGLASRPVMSWTVRTPSQKQLARAYVDQIVFEGEPD